MHELAAAVAGILVLASTVPYARDILRGQARPNRASWLMWSFLFLLTVLLQYQLESGWATLITAAECLSCFVIFGFSLRYGVGGLTKLDMVCYAIWAAAIVCWLVADRPLLALHCGIVADLVAMAPTLVKIIRLPGQESIWPFVASAAGGMLGLVAVSHLAYSVVAYPIYILAVNAFAAMLIHRYRETAPEPVALPPRPLDFETAPMATEAIEAAAIPQLVPAAQVPAQTTHVPFERPKRVIIIGNTCSA